MASGSTYRSARKEAKREGRARVTLLLAVACLLGVAFSIVALGAVLYRHMTLGGHAAITRVRGDAKTLRRGAALFWAEHRETCLDVDVLLSDGILARATDGLDPSGNPYLISCADLDQNIWAARVISAGEDRVFGTHDDVDDGDG